MYHYEKDKSYPFVHVVLRNVKTSLGVKYKLQSLLEPDLTIYTIKIFSVYMATEEVAQNDTGIIQFKSDSDLVTITTLYDVKLFASDVLTYLEQNKPVIGVNTYSEFYLSKYNYLRKLHNEIVTKFINPINFNHI